MSIVLDGLLFAIGWAHVLLAPYTKVEESFNLHATHDALMYGVGTDALYTYDHFTFPGAVPRTFIGSVLLSFLSTPAIHLASWQGLISRKADLQIIVRLVLASLNAFSLCLVRRAVSRRFGRLTGLFFTLLTISQFHLPFWMGRTLPNMFALFPVNIATSLLIDRAPSAIKPSGRSVKAAIALLTFTTVVFRAEVLLFLGPIILQSLLHKYITFVDALKVGLISGILSVVLTVIVDSYFWQQSYIWPELAGIYFNVYQGKSSEWGTSPRLAYWTAHLPKLLLSSLPLSIVGFFLDQRIRILILPSLLFVGLISGLGHKEWRFIIYVVPIFNVSAARAARWMVSRRKGSIVGRLLFLIVTGFITINVLMTYFVTLASIQNYPGGQALALLHDLDPQGYPYPVHVHISNLAAQSGASLFQQVNSAPSAVHIAPALAAYKNFSWTYNKTESLTLDDLTASKSITHLISETRPDSKTLRHWKRVGSVGGFERWEIDWAVLKLQPQALTSDRILNAIRPGTQEKLWILERKGR